MMSPRIKRAHARFGSVLLAILAVLLFGAPALAQGYGGGSGGSGGGPGGGGGEVETTGNNLSYPVVLVGGGTLSFREPPAGLDYSLMGYYWYGWIDPMGVQVACDPALLPCPPPDVDPSLVSRIYIQKDAYSVWQAAHMMSGDPVAAAYLDWSDNLEATLWSASSVVRVETVPFASTPAALGFQMWWASGKGIDEVWGARTSNADPPLPTEYPFSPNYATIYSTEAWLTLQKLEAGGGSQSAPPDTSGYIWNAAAHKWDNVAGQTVRVEPYTAEINVGGKAIYGYNWNLKREVMSVGETKEGWWRLTFSTSANNILIGADTVLTPPPPAVAPADLMFMAKVDPVNNVTYIDIFLKAAKGGGGSKR
ncbi:MAG: hypothetical protein WBS54_13285 [Acidobacteriota bacterium]